MRQIMNNNALALIGLCNEYCAFVENAPAMTRDEFVAKAVKLLPRMYIAASDLPEADAFMTDGYIEPALNEDVYEQVREGIAALLGADDTYLEVFEDDMKYSDTPIAASVAEGLADIFQSCYNFVEMIRDAPEYIAESALEGMREDFVDYWSQIVCNVMRPLNQLRHTEPEE